MTRHDALVTAGIFISTSSLISGRTFPKNRLRIVGLYPAKNYRRDNQEVPTVEQNSFVIRTWKYATEDRQHTSGMKRICSSISIAD